MSNTNPNAGHSVHSTILSNLIHAMNPSSSSSSNAMTTSGDGASISGLCNSANRQQPLMRGTLYKLHKRSGKKQKYFVIFDDAPEKPGTARLEYFDSEKKFHTAMAKSVDNGITNQKRSIILCTCFNINRRIDIPKHKHVIGLYRKDDTFSIIMKDEKEMNEWLKQLLILQRGKELLDGDQPRPSFEHVWEVTVQRRGLGESYGIIGKYRLCITDTILSLVRVGPPTTITGENRVGHVEFALANMRRCGSTQSVFFMEVGRFTATGAGEIWMETDDPMIANNMSEIILHTAVSKRPKTAEENFGPIMRIRSQSANEASKPINHNRRATIGQKSNVFESSQYATDSTESSLSSATSTTSTGTVVLNALKPKNNQTHSVSQTSLQTTGTSITTAASTKQSPSANDKSNKCHLVQCSYRESNLKEQPSQTFSTTSNNHGSQSSTTRDRCDSLTSTRIRTNSDSSSNTSNQPQLQSLPHQNGNFNYNNNNNSNFRPPPPKRIPGRPLSSFTQRNSPPNNSSPLSPPSCSESDGSSIDETDFPHDHSYVPMNSSITSKTTIPEENENWHRWNNNLSLPLNLNRKGSPAPNVLSDYMEMSSSPVNNSNVYMPMSPSGVDGGMYSSSSRASSLAEDNESSYVPMHPSSNAEDYMNSRMHPPASTNSSHASTRTGGDISSATSSCSITSGTPSTDIRFSEYHLDKVQACFTPSEDDDLLDRPPRTYSVGSKLEHTKRKLHIDRVAAEHANPRHRAYSVGSRNIKVTRAELTSHSGSHTPSHNSPVAINHHEINNNSSSSKNKKSSSAPLLASNFGRTVHGSFDHMDDLMEIDFSTRSSDSSGSNLNNISSTPVKSSPVNIPSKPNEDYMNMSGRQQQTNTPSRNAYVDMRPVGNRRISENSDNDYMDMSRTLGAVRSTTSSSLSSSPLKTTSVARTALPSNNIYVDMSPRSYDGSRINRMTSSVSSLSSAKAPSDDYLNMSPVNKSLLEVDIPQRSSVPESSYMEMSYIKPSSKDKRDNENPSSSSDEYINMDYSNNNDGAGTSDSSSSTKERLTAERSQPIAIQKKYRSNKVIKSGSVEGPPAFLPLAHPMTKASVSPTRSTNRIRCDSKDSGIVTPSSGSQATIFPFSPASPKQFDPPDDSAVRKCLVDGSGGSIKLSEDYDIIIEEPRTPVPMGLNANEKRVETLSTDYAVMNLGEPVSKKPNLAATPVQMKPTPPSHFLLETDSGNHDYINCTPTNASTNSSSKIVTPKPITIAPGHNSSQETGDYALMNPIKASATLSPVQPSANPPQASSRKSLMLTLSSQEKLNSNSCFKPIVEDDSVSSRTQLYRQTSERGRQLPNDFSYARPSLSRPNSVNSEKIKCSNSLLNRPSSANSDRLALSSTSTSSSTSTLCEIRSQNSSSQTLRNMDISVPSPMSSRPESVSSDIHMASRPASVTSTSEKELHYASLDLPPPTNNTIAPVQKMDVDQKMDFSTSPGSQQASSSSSSASSQLSSQPAFTYAQIDFIKSENLKAQQQQNQSGDCKNNTKK